MSRVPRSWARTGWVASLCACLVAVGCTETPASSPVADPAPPHDVEAVHDDHDTAISRRDRARAQLATAAYQDVEIAEADGWRSSLETLGCFQDPQRGGMGVHYLNEALLDDTVDRTRPEALVYELDADGEVTGLVAHEYIVPVEAWTRPSPPRLFGTAFHRHPTLPLYVLHAWLWKDNARGDLDDWNPAVRQCPPGVLVFGSDLPTPPGPGRP